jgi:hypothetical protein
LHYSAGFVKGKNKPKVDAPALRLCGQAQAPKTDVERIAGYGKSAEVISLEERRRG